MKKYLIVIFCMFTGFYLGAQGWQGLFPELSSNDVTLLKSGEYAVRLGIDYHNGLDLLPVGLDITSSFLEDITEYDPELVVEMLYIFDKPEVAANDMILYLLNNIRAFSDQVGIEYFSNRKQAMSLLVEDCYFTSSDGKNRLPDPVVSSIIPIQEDFYYQKDTTFGANKYMLKTKTTEESIWLQMENINKLKVYSFFTALGAGGQRVNFIIHPVGDKVVFYAIAQIKEEPKIKKILTYEVNIPYSFQRRMNSIALWYKERL